MAIAAAVKKKIGKIKCRVNVSIRDLIIPSAAVRMNISKQESNKK